MYVCMCVLYMYLCMYVCMYVLYIYVCMYVCVTTSTTMRLSCTRTNKNGRSRNLETHSLVC